MIVIPQGLKPFVFQHCSARLKSCPDASCGSESLFPQFVKSRPDTKLIFETRSRVVSQKFIEEQPQILRLTTPNLHPTNEDLFVGTPEGLKNTPGAPFAQDDSRLYAAYF